MLYFNNRYGNLNDSQQINPLYYSNDIYTNQAPSVNLNISYQNFIVEDKLAAQKKKYGNDLLEQIREKELKKRLELQKKKEEEMEELRLRKENEKYNQLTKTHDITRFKVEKKEDEENKQKELRIKQTPIYRAYLNAESLNPFMEIINAKKSDQEQYTNEVINKMKEMYDRYSIKIKEIDDQIKNIRLLNFHNNLYKVDLVKELSEVKSELAAKRYQDNFKRDYIYKAFMNTKQKKQEMDEYFAINQTKLPIINLSHQINCPGMRLRNGWYHKDNINHKESKQESNALTESLLNNYRKINILNRYERDYIF